MDVECLFMAKNPLMGASSGSAFLILFAMMDRLGLIIACVPVRAGEMVVLLNLGLGGFNLVVATAELKSCGMDPSLPVQLTLPGVWKMRAPLCAASVTLAFGSTVWCEPKISLIPVTSSVTSWLIGLMAPWMISGTNRLLNKFYVKFPLVV